jgi:hypothetical protein
MPVAITATYFDPLVVQADIMANMARRVLRDMLISDKIVPHTSLRVLAQNGLKDKTYINQ